MPVKERGWILYNLWRMPQELLVWLPPVPAIGMVSARQFQWWSCVIAFHGYILTGNCVQISKQMQRHCERNENKLWPSAGAEGKADIRQGYLLFLLLEMLYERSKEKRIMKIRHIWKLQMTPQRIISLTAAGPGNWDDVRTAVQWVVIL